MRNKKEKKKPLSNRPDNRPDGPSEPDFTFKPENEVLQSDNAEELILPIPQSDSENVELMATIEGLTKELEEMTGSWQRERASFQNYKRRVDEEKREIRKYACFDLALELVRVIDYFESSVTFSENLPKEAENVIIGVKYTLVELTRVLEANGVVPIAVEKGQPFDTMVMEAIERKETSELPPDSVLLVQQRGWMLYDRILRPARVIVTASRHHNDAEI
jgi:molecular chaperone GrpE